ncbi:hypothetical protein FXO37_27187 [Capsicum annuum]|nr:hypothetical protein FXO37_27187 [Capsicum annuum]
MDDGETSGDDNIIGKDAALVACSVSHPSMKIPYLDNTEESTEDFAYTRDDSSNQASLWNFKNLEFIQISWYRILCKAQTSVLRWLEKSSSQSIILLPVIEKLK